VRPFRHEIVVGWVERVSLPQLGLTDLEAKIDTGARTSALHVLSVEPVFPASATGRPLYEVRLAAHGHAAPTVVRVSVREFVAVRDTSGRLERRPVIETTLQLGPIRRRVRVTLTNRGDMAYPMLVGRTALAGFVVVDPSRRHRLQKPISKTKAK
jgi:hypothetical protein